MYLQKYNILNRMEITGEHVIGFFTIFFGAQGFFLFLAKKWFEKKERRDKIESEVARDEREHKQALEIKRLEKESLSTTLHRFGEGNIFLNKIIIDYNCDWAGLIKISNGEKFSDGEHIWKYSVTQQSDQGIEFKFIHDLHKKPLEETGTLFSTLKQKGFAFVNIEDEKNLTTFSQRLQKRGVIAYCLVSTNDVMNSMMVCWAKKAKGIDITNETLAQMMGDFRAKEGYLI